MEVLKVSCTGCAAEPRGLAVALVAVDRAACAGRGPAHCGKCSLRNNVSNRRSRGGPCENQKQDWPLLRVRFSTPAPLAWGSVALSLQKQRHRIC